MGSGKTDHEDPTSPNALEEKATQRKAMSDRQRSVPELGPVEAAYPGLASETALHGDYLDRSMKSFQNRLNSACFDLCICTALAYLCT
jgi:hypothetical protein